MTPQRERAHARSDRPAAEDAAAVDEALTRAVTILKAVQTERPE